jgi:hypothetical protein
MAVELTYRGMDITSTTPPDENHLEPTISGAVRFQLASEIWNTPLEIPFENCEGEAMAKAQAFRKLAGLVVDLRAAIGRARIANGLPA